MSFSLWSARPRSGAGASASDVGGTRPVFACTSLRPSLGAIARDRLAPLSPSDRRANPKFYQTGPRSAPSGRI
eukprot:2960958-Pyramimonas_sp.AAC.1